MSTIHNIRSSHFKSDTREAIANVELRGALARAQEKSNTKRDRAIDRLADDWESMREQARAVKAWTLENLADQLELFEQNAVRNGIRCTGPEMLRAPAKRSTRSARMQGRSR